MLKQTHLTAMVSMLVGALLGHAAASGRLNAIDSRTIAAAESLPARQDRDVADGGDTKVACSSNGMSNGQLLAKAETRPMTTAARGQAEAKKPNILVIFGDDIGQTNISAYSMRLMGYRTPNIDRIAKEGMIFTDYYAEQSCTAGRSSFITGQSRSAPGSRRSGCRPRRCGCRRKTPR
jgi:hypothetical protein